MEIEQEIINNIYNCNIGIERALMSIKQIDNLKMYHEMVTGTRCYEEEHRIKNAQVLMETAIIELDESLNAISMLRENEAYLKNRSGQVKKITNIDD